jgi:hypothetical protein
MALGPDGQELVSATVEGITTALIKQVGDVMRELGGDEIAETAVLNIRFWKIKQAARLAQRLEEYLRPLGINRRPVALKLLLPSFEYAALEEDDDLQDYWAALLASAADSRVPAVHPSFPEILKQLTARDARLLKLLNEVQAATHGRNPFAAVLMRVLREESVDAGFEAPPNGEFDFRVSIETLIRLRLAWQTQEGWSEGPNATGIEKAYKMTDLGGAFLRVVSLPGEQPARGPFRSAHLG